MDIKDAVNVAIHIAYIQNHTTNEFSDDLHSLVSFVSKISNISLGEKEKKVLKNIYRDDIVSVEKNIYISSFLDNAPKSKRRHVVSPASRSI